MIDLTFHYYRIADTLPSISNHNIYTNSKHEFFTKDGLYSEQIFGPVNNYKCQCGKIFGKINAGVKCPDCEVLCDRNSLRSEIFAKIDLPEGIYIINPIFKNSVREIFGRHAVKNIMSKGAYNSNKEAPYYFSLSKNKLVKSTILGEKENIIDFPVFDITSLKKLFYIIKDELDNPLEELVNPETGEFYTEADLIERGITPIYKYRHILDSIQPDLLDFIFINYVLVTDPNSRQVIKISNTKIVPHPISKAYIEILKNISKGTSVLDNLYNQNSDFFGHTVYKYQYSVDSIYEEILHFNFQKKENYVRESLTGKTIEFSQRAVLIPNPALRPYQAGLPEESIRKVYLPDLLRFLYLEYQDRELELMKNGEIYKCDIVDYIQYIYDKFNSNVELEIQEKDIKKFLEENLHNFHGMIERQPVLWRWSSSGLQLARSYGDRPMDILHLPDVRDYGIDPKYQYLVEEALEEYKEHLLKVKERSPVMFKLFLKSPDVGLIALVKIKIKELEGTENAEE